MGGFKKTDGVQLAALKARVADLEDENRKLKAEMVAMTQEPKPRKPREKKTEED